MTATLNEQMDAIRQGTIDLLPEDELARKIENSIKTNKPLVAKLGCDPSRPDLHLGHAVVLHKLRLFQDLGHTAVLIIGDFTGMIGDPTGKSKTRPQLTIEETIANGKSYLEQATIILSENNLSVRYNSEWLGKMNFGDVIRLSAKYTVAQILERDDFAKRYKNGLPISIHEFMYPLAQAYDSYAIDADIELGGSDQKFNLLVGREIKRAYGLEPQCILTMPLLEGTDGVEKMSKSLDNYIALTDTPKEMFGKVMSIPDSLLLRYLQYAALAKQDEVNNVKMGLSNGELHPRNVKVDIAKRVIALYHGEEQGQQAFEEFERIFKNKELPDDVPLITIKTDDCQIKILDLLVRVGVAPSKKEAKRLVEQGGVYVDGETFKDPMETLDISQRRLLKVGKRKFYYICDLMADSL
ncbi:MAG: tyrosine--tRNA ligase [Ignavibacteria bacterium]|jgi:tyrosyl-tRNA synthetase|nr:tyrosine--tRNA ligase [Ignavibacteria bacterium]